MMLGGLTAAQQARVETGCRGDMGGKRGSGNEMLREQLAQEAARLIVDHGMHDYGRAKRKAALRFGVREANALPSNLEIESSVIERQRIFAPELHEHRLASEPCAEISASCLVSVSKKSPSVIPSACIVRVAARSGSG